MSFLHKSSLEHILKKPNRKTHSETILRTLLTTSYPTAVISNIALQLKIGYGPDTGPTEELEIYADDLRLKERKLKMVDFIRCLEIVKVGDNIRVVAKKLDGIPDLQSIVDHTKNHIPVISHTFDIPKTELNPDIVDVLANYIAEVFFKTQMFGIEKKKYTNDIEWILEEKTVSGRDRKINTVKTPDVVNVIKTTLSETNYHLLLTTNAIVIRGKGLRISIPKRKK